MIYLAGGVGLGMMASKYSKDIKKMMKKGKKEVSKMANNVQNQMKNN
jgi:mRNA-degrading endonuclease YafQ of YafQ-DinJ toxin-antitoxin module